MARSTEKDITGFLGKSACDKAFSDFFIFFWSLTIVVGVLSCLFHCEPKKISSLLVKGDSVVCLLVQSIQVSLPTHELVLVLLRPRSDGLLSENQCNHQFHQHHQKQEVRLLQCKPESGCPEQRVLQNHLVLQGRSHSNLA